MLVLDSDLDHSPTHLQIVVAIYKKLLRPPNLNECSKLGMVILDIEVSLLATGNPCMEP